MNEIHHHMSLKAINLYLDERLKQEQEYFLYRSLMAEYMSVLAQGKTTSKSVSFVKECKKIYNKNNVVEDNRSASEIIDDTFKRFGLTLKKGE